MWLTRVKEGLEWRYPLATRRDASRRRHLRKTFVNGEELLQKPVDQGGLRSREWAAMVSRSVTHLAARRWRRRPPEVWFHEAYTKNLGRGRPGGDVAG